jgi:hypothetical protein
MEKIDAEWSERAHEEAVQEPLIGGSQRRLRPRETHVPLNIQVHERQTSKCP